MFDQTTTIRTLNHIKMALRNNLKEKYNITDREVEDDILLIHGLHKDNFDFIQNIGTIINDKLNDVSVDDNSNKNEKTIESINSEVLAPCKKAVGYDYLYRVMKENFGKKEANRLIGEMMDLSLGLSDSTNILKCYCWSIDASKLITDGRKFGVLHSKPCKRIQSYTSSLCETIHQMSSHLAGALAVGTFFLDFTHLCMYRHRFSIDDIRNNKDIRKNIENEFQQFIHSVNHLSRNSCESPFTNISLFSPTKLETLVSRENYGWYFPRDNFSKDEIIEYIMEVQKLFLDFFDKGDPSKSGMPYRFPIVTINLAKDDDGNLIDKDFLDYICGLDIYKYNIFTSSGTKIASCCRLINNGELLDMASSVNSFGGGMVSLGSHRVVTINFHRIVLEANSPHEFYRILDNRIESAAKILKSHKELLNVLTEKGLQQFIHNKWIMINRLFSTFGILGIYECKKTYLEKWGNGNSDVIKDILIYMNDKVNKASKEYGIVGNIEQIPAESFAVRLAVADKLIFGENKVPYNLYANQFVPLWEDANIWEKLEIDGRYNKLITGGGIVHAQIGEKVTPTQAKNIIIFANRVGCEHFALNAVYTQFDDGSMLMGKLVEHPNTGSIAVDYFTRVVGFFTPVSSWNKTRRKWEFDRRTFINLNDSVIF